MSFIQSLEKPSLPGIDPVKTTPNELMRDHFKYYLKNIHRVAATSTYIMAMVLLVFAMGTLKDWLLRNVEQNHWLSWGSCDLACAKYAAKIHFSVFLVGFLIVLSLAWGPAFYFFNKRVPRAYNYVSAMKMECSLLFLVGIFVAMTALQSKGWANYETFAAQHWAGTLTRQPASK